MRRKLVRRNPRTRLRQRNSDRQTCPKRSVNSGRVFLRKRGSTGRSLRKRRRRSTSRCTPTTYIAHSAQNRRRGRRRRVGGVSRASRTWTPTAFRARFPSTSLRPRSITDVLVRHLLLLRHIRRSASPPSICHLAHQPLRCTMYGEPPSPGCLWIKTCHKGRLTSPTNLSCILLSHTITTSMTATSRTTRCSKECSICRVIRHPCTISIPH